MHVSVDPRVAALLAAGYCTDFAVGHWVSAQTYPFAIQLGWLNSHLFLSLSLIAFGVLFSIKKNVRPNRLLDYIAAIACCLVCVFIFAFKGADGITTLMAVLIVRSVARTWLLAEWALGFSRAQTPTMVCGLLAGMAAVSLFKLGMATLPANVTFAAILACPLASVVCLHRLPGFKRQNPAPVGSIGDTTGSFQTLASLWPMALTAVLFFTMWAVFNMELKLTGGHYGFGSTSSPSLTLVAQAIDLAFVIALFIWAFVLHRRLSVEHMWRYAFAAFAVALVVISWAGLIPTAQAFSSASFGIADFLLWVTLADIGHQSPYDPRAVFCFGLLAYELSDWLARSAVTLGLVLVGNPITDLALLAVVFVVSFLLPHRTPGCQVLLQGLNGDARTSGGDRADAGSTSIERGCEMLARQCHLTTREKEILLLLCYGRSKGYIAQTLGLSENTIRTYARRIYAKTGVHSRSELQEAAGFEASDVLRP